MNRDTAHYSEAGAVAEAIIAKTGQRIVLALPLGLGKANHIANAMVTKAAQDPSIHLDIFTALTLEAPPLDNELKRRFLEPVRSRLFGDYPPLEYAKRLREGALPANIRVNEFFFSAGQWLGIDRAQREYISANYTHAIEYVINRGANVVAQLVARREGPEGPEYSMSCNPDITVDLLEQRRNGGIDFVFAAQVNSELPFMDGDAQIPANEIDLLLDSPETDFELFSIPRLPLSLEEQAIGLHVAKLIPDNGTLQIGIGSVGDAVTQALIVRHNDNPRFKDLITQLTPNTESPLYQEDPFKQGLHGVSEMFVAGFLHLAHHGILTREVDSAILRAAFFVETHDFYKMLREMPDEERARSSPMEQKTARSSAV